MEEVEPAEVQEDAAEEACAARVVQGFRRTTAMTPVFSGVGQRYMAAWTLFKSTRSHRLGFGAGVTTPVCCQGAFFQVFLNIHTVEGTVRCVRPLSMSAHGRSRTSCG